MAWGLFCDLRHTSFLFLLTSNSPSWAQLRFGLLVVSHAMLSTNPTARWVRGTSKHPNANAAPNFPNDRLRDAKPTICSHSDSP